MPEDWEGVAAAQEGVISRRQLLDLGLSRDQARRHIDDRRWQTLWPGVYLTHSGPRTDLALVWGAVLFCGKSALAGGRTALWLVGAVPRRTGPVEVCVPHPGPRRPAQGIQTRQARGQLDRRRADGPGPPRLQVEHAVLDVADRETDPEAVCDIVLRVVQLRLTTSRRIGAALADRARHRWRALISEILQDFDEGVHSPLERRYLRLEAAHGLPQGTRNLPQIETDGRTRYRDVRYDSYQLVVELDGREAHPVHEAFRDLRRDNAAALGGETVLRYGWRDVTQRPCLVAQQVATTLARRGWSRSPTSCSPTCPLS